MTNPKSPYSGFYVTTRSGHYVSGPYATVAEADAAAEELHADLGKELAISDPECVVDMPDLDYDARELARGIEEDRRVEAAIDERRGV